MIEKAIEIALNAHKEQTDKNGQPYILHVMRVVAFAVKKPLSRLID